MNSQLFEHVDHYINDLLVPHDEVLKGTIQSLRENGMPDISVSPAQGKLLQVLALLCNAKNILELGTLAGYSTTWLAGALPADGKLISLEYEEKYAAVARKNLERAGLQDKVTIRTGRALDTLPLLAAEQAGPFDLIFIDADKPPYAAYFQWALKLSRPGTLIIADNVIRDGQVLDARSTDERVQGVRRFNELLAACTEVTATILQTVGVKGYDGMAIAVVNRT